MGDRLRARDLARSAGLSVQQIRTYVETGVLPAVERTAGGHRVFTGAHAEALIVARELAAGHGWATTRVVMRAVHDGDLVTALAAVDASHARLDRERGELAAVREALETLLTGRSARSGRVNPPCRAERSGDAGPGGGTEHAARQDAARHGLRIGEVARAVGVSPPVLRLWEAHGLLRPEREPSTGYRRYDSSELRAAHVVALLRQGSHPLPAIGAVLDELRATGSPDRVLRELTHRTRDLHRTSLRRLAASAALHGYLRSQGHTV
ncbi:MerR family transcriptional regulator [Streptomyces xinghaiensis]|uniref:MerR family transcriptional regulator n=1 Tax=Streptomyces xinghaiensis TaxID=1038928 RepID=UPI0002D3E929|nr:MerR family transcriptional regulator [Streptomyces xinghaiensis]MZE81024.1 MerR family transcriptional regulator [Streptomyces sp. SID5475]